MTLVSSHDWVCVMLVRSKAILLKKGGTQDISVLICGVKLCCDDLALRWKVVVS